MSVIWERLNTLVKRRAAAQIAVSIGWLMGFHVLTSSAETLVVVIHGLRKK